MLNQNLILKKLGNNSTNFDGKAIARETIIAKINSKNLSLQTENDDKQQFLIVKVILTMIMKLMKIYFMIL